MCSVFSLESYTLNMEYIVNHSPYLSLILGATSINTYQELVDQHCPSTAL